MKIVLKRDLYRLIKNHRKNAFHFYYKKNGYSEFDLELFIDEGKFINVFVVDNFSIIKEGIDFNFFLKKAKKKNLSYRMKNWVVNGITTLWLIMGLFWALWIVILRRSTFDYSNGNNAHIYVIEYKIMPILTIVLLVGSILWLYFLLKTKPLKKNNPNNNYVGMYEKYLDEVLEKIKEMPETLVNQKLKQAQKLT